MCKTFLNNLSDKFSGNNKIQDLVSDIRDTEELDECHDCGDWEFQDNMQSCYEGDFTICESCCDDNYRLFRLSWNLCSL